MTAKANDLARRIVALSEGMVAPPAEVAGPPFGSNGQGSPSTYHNALDGRVAKDAAWLLRPYIPAAMTSLVAGAGGATKTLCACYFTSVVTGRPTGHARAFFDCTTLVEPGNVLIFALESSLEFELVPRLMAADANLDRITVNPSMRCSDGTWRDLNPFFDVDETAELVAKTNTKFVWIDPTGDWIGLRTDPNRDSSVREALKGINRIADQTGVAILLVHHLSKSPFAGPSERILGSVAYRNVPRAVFLMDFHVADKEVPDEKDRRRVFVPDKTSLVAKPEAIVFTLETVAVAGMNDRVPRLLPVSRERIHVEELGAGIAPLRGDTAAAIETFLREVLADGEEHPSADVEREAEKRGFKWSTVKAVRKKTTDVRCRKPAYEGGWVWWLE